MGVTLVGTTDLDHRDDLALEPSITREEFDYLLEALNAQFPTARIEQHDVISTFAGVRPVVASGREKPSSESRDHVLLEENGLVTITGGKLTTFRPMALLALREACKRARRQIDVRPARIFPEAAPTGSSRLNGRYGADAAKVLDMARADEQQPIGATETTWIELRYAMRNECVVHLDDLLLRRTRLGLQLRDGAAEVFPRLQPLCAEELGWDAARWNAETERYRERIRQRYSLPA
jgi:glycerol-3-phosphate dehydrogenase